MSNSTKDFETPLLDDLEKGEWPSFVKEIKQPAVRNPMAKAGPGGFPRP